MNNQADVVSRATSNLAIAKLIPIGEILDMLENDLIEMCANRYRARAADAFAVVQQFRKDPRVRTACRDSTSLMELLENADFEHGEGTLSAARTAAKS